MLFGALNDEFEAFLLGLVPSLPQLRSLERVSVLSVVAVVSVGTIFEHYFTRCPEEKVRRSYHSKIVDIYNSDKCR